MLVIVFLRFKIAPDAFKAILRYIADGKGNPLV